ncbi:LysR substrate-binding domain-containing protein [Pseudogemmobacter faecipullorum]|uniref:LysR family transcriptional regulator n=1 Tax=Pseudogemmobacter faecipullorum TaxID=2755041 RepID=A0ABS8CLS7_9RHOB|nr:LysR substrate-binding domain-containing protein [Pseudogemmobacter faecipullorum]MCB5410335.1 LysR family transcriptional regulator [Pseudogemmobacter faecipullorum]
MITLKHLRYFSALAQHRHFQRAADACAISQPALSLQMKELEAVLGAPLIERGSRQISITPLGEQFEIRALRILQEVAELTDLARAARERIQGELRLGVISTIAPYLLPPVIRRLMADMPGIDLRPRETTTDKLLEELAHGRLDAAIMALPASQPGLEEHFLFEEEFLLVRPSGEAGQPLPFPGLLPPGLRLLLLEEGHCFRDQALGYCTRKNEVAPDMLEGTSLATLVQMVEAGMGITLIPEMALKRETRGADVAITRLCKPRPTRRIGMVWRSSSPLSDHLRRIAELIGAEYHSLRQQAGPEIPA